MGLLVVLMLRLPLPKIRTIGLARPKKGEDGLLPLLLRLLIEMLLELLLLGMPGIMMM